MIIKNVPQYLNKASDEKLLKPIEMLDAENVQVSSDDDGNAGIVKTIKGNAHVEQNSSDEVYFTPASLKVIGSVAIPKKQQVVYFAKAEANLTNIDHIYVYDVDLNKYKILYRGNQLGFNIDSFVESSVVFNGDDEAIVYFTDGVGEPKKMNVDRLLANRSDIWKDADGINYYTDTDRDEFFAVCKTPPLTPITFEYTTDTAVQSNNVTDKTFQFAYQYIYKDGEVSAVSTYSKIAINPNTFGTGVVEPEFERENNKIVLSYQNGGSEVESIRFLARLGGTTVFYKIGEVNNGTGANPTFDFTNDGMFPAVSTAEIDKVYDNVPLKANAQSISGNRLVYGDYTEGYDNVAINVESSITYKDVENTGTINATLQSISLGNGPAIIIDGTNMAASYGQGAIIRLKVTLSGSSGSFRISRDSPSYLFSEDYVVGSDNGNYGLGQYTGNPSTNNYVDIPYNTDKVLSATIIAGSVMTRDEILDEIETQFAATSNAVYDYTNNGVNYNATGVVTSVGSGTQSYSVGDPVEVGLDFPEIELAFTADSAYTVTNKRKIDIEFDVLKAKVHYNSGISKRLVQIDGHPLNDTRTTAASYLGVANFRYISTTNVTLAVDVKRSLEAGLSSFKTSAMHNFGIVYYDAKGRASFVQKIDGVFVGGYTDSNRSTSLGRVQINLKIKHNPPSWAKKYQIVYGGNETYSKFLQYGVAGAHYISDQDSIYLDLFPLEGKNNSYSKDKGANLDYTYQDGDMLRIISFHDSSQNRVYVDDQIYNVLGKELVTDASEVTPSRASTYVVIRDEDYSSKTYSNFNLTKVKAGSDDWGQRVMVEIVSPNTVNNDTVYYEIGEVYDITSGAHVGDITDGGYPVVQLTDGDIYFKPREVLVAPFDSSSSEYDEDDYSNYEYETFYVESSSVSDYFDSEVTSRGRPHAINEDAKQVRRRSSVTYSDPYIADSAVLSLSSFNPATANFSDFEIRHGKIDKLVDQTDRLYVFQEHKVGIVGVNRNILETLTDQNVVVSNVVFSTPNYYAGDFGSSGYPAAVVERFGMMYFVDVKAQRVLRISRDGITPISDPNMDSFFDKKFSSYLTESGKTELDIVAGYDPDNSEYVLTSKDRGSYTGFTIGYSHNKRVFTSFYSFKPDFYTHINDRFFSFKVVSVSGTQQYMWEHGAGSTYGNFYGTDYDAKISIIANANPSMVKAFQALSLEGDSVWSAVVSTSNQTTSIATGDFDERERGYYAAIPRDTSASTANYITIGIVDDVTGTAVTFDNKINRMPIPLGAALYKVDGSSLTNLNATVSSIDSSKKLTTSTALTSSEEGKTIVAKLSAKDEGDVLRDYYAKIELTNSVHNKKSELYAVNTVFVDSPMHSALSQR